ncbi:MAG: hydrogenase maturation protease [Cyanobacteriota bacterium]|nr:hydrogenase maturation protease [Cyanobacteriota bacterium]
MKPDLLIGLGNPLRGDDGVGAMLVEELVRQEGEERSGRKVGAARWPGAANLRTVHQLTPELALAVAESGRVLFVDAWANPDRLEPWIEALRPTPVTREAPPSASPGGHGWGPQALVALAEGLYNWRGEAALLRVPAFAFPHGFAFSPALKQTLPAARTLIRQWRQGG